MKRPTRDQLLQQNLTLQGEAGLLHCVLNDLVNGEVKWFRSGKQALGIARPAGPAGGIVIHSFCQDTGGKYSCAYHWENWFPGVRDYFGADKDSLALRDLALEAHNWILTQHAG